MTAPLFTVTQDDTDPAEAVDAPTGTDEPALTITVHGQPKPKGSLRHIGHGRLVEQLAGSKPWREAVKYATLDARTLPGNTPETITGPVRVDITITVDKPKSAPKKRRTWPITRSSGDIDKHIRNVFDALVDAAAIGDDSQVVRVSTVKAYPLEEPDTLASAGAIIRIYRIGEGDV